MKARKIVRNRRKMDERGVSPVIGVILMVAATIVIAAVVMGMLGGFGPPKKSATISATATRTPTGNISITYIGGPDQALVNESAPLEYTVSNASGSYSGTLEITPTVGNTTKIPSAMKAGEDHLTVIVTLKDGTKQVILDTYV